MFTYSLGPLLTVAFKSGFFLSFFFTVAFHFSRCLFFSLKLEEVMEGSVEGLYASVADGGFKKASSLAGMSGF